MRSDSLLIAFVVTLSVGCSSESSTVVSADLATSQEVSQSSSATQLPETQIEFGTMSHDFGRIVQGEQVSHRFSFRNTGTNPLQIVAVKPSCGCTTPAYTKEAVAPGSEGFVEVLFKSEGQSGTQSKSIQVFANTAPRVTVLSFTGEVVKE